MLLKNSKVIVIKIGSALIVDNNKKIRKKWLLSFAKDIKNVRTINVDIVIKFRYIHENFLLLDLS